MILKKISKNILWATIEDYAGLWEVLWEVNSLTCENTYEENKKIAYVNLVDFLKKGIVDFFYCVEPYGELKKIENINEILNLLKNDKYWHEPEKNEISIRVGSTEKGKKYYENEI